MTKKTVIVILTALLAFLMIGALAASIRNKNSKPQNSSSVTDEMFQDVIIPSEMPVNISVPIPAGFQETQSERYDKYYIREDASIIITGEELAIHGQKLADYTNNTVLRQYEKSADDFHLISNTDYASGAPCRILEFTYALIGEDVRQDYQCITAVLLKDDYVYIVTCKSKKETFFAYRGVFLSMIGKISIADRTPLPAESNAAQPADSSGFGAELSGTAP